MKLKLCPFCGSKPIIYKDKYGIGWGVECQNIECEITPRTNAGFSERKFAIDAWNKRNTQPSIHRNWHKDANPVILSLNRKAF